MDRLTRRQLLTGLGLGAAAGGLAACSAPAAKRATAASGPVSQPGAASASPPVATPSSAPAVAPTPSPTPRTSATLNEAALRRKLAGLIVVGFRGLTPGDNASLTKAIDAGLGGVIYFDKDQPTGGVRNIQSPAQVRALSAGLRKRNPKLIVSIDQEGGVVSRLNPAHGFPATKSEAQIGAERSMAATRTWAQGIVRTLTDAGITLNYAPVVDMAVNPNNPAIAKLGRSFGATPDIVVANATVEVDVHRAARVKTVLKHFPGFGSASGNTDFGVVDVTKTWRPIELEPFRRLIASGHADSVMAAHLLNDQLDKGRPASLSPKVVGGLLRGDLGFRGPVVSDDMQAVAITSKYGHDEAVAMAFAAGVDLLVFANQETYDESVFARTVDVLVGLVKGGHVTMAQVDAASRRVDTLRP